MWIYSFQSGNSFHEIESITYSLKLPSSLWTTMGISYLGHARIEIDIDK